MKKIYGVVIFSFFFLAIQAQNFLNGDFENNTAGGTDQINLSNATFNTMMPNTTAFGTYGDMDIITSATYSGLAQSGNWYVAFTGTGTDMIAMQLSAPLVPGNNYTIRFYDRGAAGYAPYPFQIGLSTNSTSFGTAIYTTPVAPTIGVWTPRTFTFTAPNNGQYITVTMTAGGLGDWAHTDNFTFLCSLNLGPDTAICGGGSYTIDATTAGATAYLWQDGSTNPTYNVTLPGTYWAQVTTPTCTMRDTVVVSSGTNGSLFLGNDTTVCNGNNVVLNATTAGATAYLWQDNSINPTYTVSSTGTYWAHVTVGGCTLSDTINVAVGNAGSLNIGNDTTICTGNTVLLNATTVGATAYLWHDNSTNATYTAASSGIYWARVTAGACVSSDTVVVTVNTPPSQSFTVNPVAVCAGQPVALAYTGGSNSGAAYTWNFNGATIITGSGQGPFQVSWNTTGTMNITLDVIDNGCTTPQVVHSVTVSPNVIASAGPDVTICSGGSVQLGAANTAGHTYLWTPALYLSATNISDPAYSAHNLTTNPVITSYIVTESNNGCSGSDTVIVTLNPVAPTTISPSGSIAFCAGGSVTLKADSVYANYLWNNNNTSNSITVSQSGTFSMAATDAAGCEYLSNSIPVTVNPNPVLSLISLNNESCFGFNDGNITVATGSGTPAYSYVWNTTPVQTAAALSNLSSGNYAVTVYDANQCFDTSSYSITAAAPFSLVLNSINNVSCFGAADGNIDVSAIGGTTPYQYVWSSGGTGSPLSNLNAGTYLITVSDANNCSIDSSFSITEPAAVILQSLVFDSVRFSTEVVLTEPAGNNYTYQWSPTQFLSCSDCAAPVFSGVRTTEYHVTATDAGGCSATATVLVNVVADKQVFVPNAFTPNGDGQNDKWLVSAAGAIYFNAAVFNRWGEKVFEANNINEGWDGTYQSKPAYAGVYTYVVTLTFLDGENRRLKGGVTLIR